MTVVLRCGDVSDFCLDRVSHGPDPLLALRLTVQLPLSELLAAVSSLQVGGEAASPARGVAGATNLRNGLAEELRGRRRHRPSSALSRGSRDFSGEAASRDVSRGAEHSLSPSPERSFVAVAGDYLMSYDPYEQIEGEVLFRPVSAWCPGPAAEEPLEVQGFDEGKPVPVIPEIPSPPETSLPAQEKEGEAEAAEVTERPRPALGTLRGHSSWVNAVAWAPDGTRLITGSSNHTACVWQSTGPHPWQWKSVKTLRMRVDAGTRDGFRALAWSPEGGRIAAAGLDNDVRLWSTGGADGRHWEAAGVLQGHTEPVRAIGWSPSGRKVITGSDDKTARIWRANRLEANTWETYAILRGHSDSVRAVAWSPDKVSVATACFDSTVCVWQPMGSDARQWEVIATLAAHTAPVRSLAWSPDRTILLTGGDTTARLWQNSRNPDASPTPSPGASEGNFGDPPRWSELAVLRGHTATIKVVTWSPGGGRIATGGADAVVHLWAPDSELLSEWSIVATYSGHSAAIRALTWCPDGSKLLSGSGDRTAKIWDAPHEVWSPTELG